MEHFSQMTRYEINTYVEKKREEMRKAEMMGVENEYRVLERQILIAQSYLVDLSQIIPGKIYKVIHQDDIFFKVDYLKGVFAWGFFIGQSEKETGIPVSMLQLPKRG